MPLNTPPPPFYLHTQCCDEMKKNTISTAIYDLFLQHYFENCMGLNKYDSFIYHQ